MAPVEAFLLGASGVAGVAFAFGAILIFWRAMATGVQVYRRYDQASHPRFRSTYQGGPLSRRERLKWAVWAALKYPRIYH